MAKRKKITVVGAGNVGASVAQLLIYKNLGDVVLIDIEPLESMAKGKALDLVSSAPLEKFDSHMIGSANYKDSANSDIIVITAGLARKPGMSRQDLVDKNSAIVKSVAEAAIKESPNAFMIVVSNPLDTMSYVAKKFSGLPSNRILGMAGVLDSTRFRAFIAMELGVSHEDVNATVLGLHGDDMVPMPRFSSVAGIPITELLSEEKINALVDRTKRGGAEIVELLKTGSAYYAPASSTVNMVESILLDKKRIIPAAAYLNGEYGLKDIFMGVPVTLDGSGVSKIWEFKLTDAERAALNKSADAVRASIAALKV